ncbi:MAG: OsmC family protein [Gemmatimonadota bacterium]|nr:OsmC family protein [Gemmatimonadota bacterium]
MTSSNENLRQIRLRWSGDGLVFRGGPDGGPEVVVDGGADQGPAPMQQLLLAVAGCMGIDIKMILEKSRVPMDGLEIEAIGERAEEAPRRYVRLELVCRVKGPGPEDAEKVLRAVELSRDKYCSVLHSLDPSMDVTVTVPGFSGPDAASLG